MQVPSLAQGAYSPAQTYSPKDIGQVVGFAAERGVRVLPEIDMPGVLKRAIYHPSEGPMSFPKSGASTPAQEQAALKDTA